MFTSNKVSKSMLDAVSKVLAEEEVQPKKKLILEPEKEKAKVAEEDEKKPASPFDWKNTPRTTLKPGERTGHEHKKTSTGNVFIKKYKKEKMEEEADCVTEPKAKEIAKKEVKGHEKAMHKEEVEQYLQEATMTGIEIKKSKGKLDSDTISKHDVHYNGKKIGHIEAYQHRSGVKYGWSHHASGEGEAGERSMTHAIAGLRSAHAEHLKNQKDSSKETAKSLIKLAKMKEEVEQIDELSKSTLGSYVKSAARDVGASRKLGADFKNMADKSRNPSSKAAASRLSDKFDAVAQKRHAGIGKAVERLAKEEFSIESFMAEEFTEEQLDEMINEVLSKSAKAGDWIHDFVHSDNPKFKGKSKEKRKQMALAAYYAKQRNEEVEQLEEGGIGDLPNKGMTGSDTKGPFGVYHHDGGPGVGKLKIVSKHKTLNSALKHINKLTKKSGKNDHFYGHLSSHQPEQGTIPKHFHEEVQHLEELADLADTSNEEALAPDQRTTDTLRGREKGGKHNQHSAFKVKLKAEEKVDEMKRPLDGDTFVTNEESPLKLAKHIAKKSFHKIRQETMMGKAGATSEEKENE